MLGVGVEACEAAEDARGAAAAPGSAGRAPVADSSGGRGPGPRQSPAALRHSAARGKQSRKLSIGEQAPGKSRAFLEKPTRVKLTLDNPYPN